MPLYKYHTSTIVLLHVVFIVHCINTGTNAVLIQGLSINYAFLCSKLCFFMLANYAYLCSDYAQLCFYAFMLEVCHYAFFYARIIGPSQTMQSRLQNMACAGS